MTLASTHSDKAHYSVMLEDICEALAIKEGGIYADCTFGRGGYSRAILSAVKDVKVIALDRDPTAKEHADILLKEFPEGFMFAPSCFDDLDKVLEGLYGQESKLDGIVFDLGVSSPQLDVASRGFSFRFEGPLDMRMTPEGETAADVVNTYGEEDLANLIYKYGEEKKSRIVAKAIVMDRQKQLFKTTTDLAELLRRIIPKSKDGIDPATRTFQALRIHVNDELGQLERALEKSLDLLKVGGRLVVVSFHSLEDRIVKQFFVAHGKRVAVNRYRPDLSTNLSPLKILTKKAVMASQDETKINPRSRSAKMRVAEYTGGAHA